MSSTYNSPFNLARRFASLDHISGGRAGWNVVTSFDTQTSKNCGLDEHLDYATRYGRALESVQVIQARVSEDGRNLAARVAEGIYAPGGSLAEAQAYYADIKRRAAEVGRDPTTW